MDTKYIIFLITILILLLLVLAYILYDGKYRFFHIFNYMFYNNSRFDINQLKKKYNNVIVSLTTSPKRLPKIKSVIESITSQTIKPKKIVLNLPHVFKRDGSTYENIPDFIEKNELIQINRCDDIGPATKIIPTAILYEDPETILISIDDDTVYSNIMIERLLNFSEKNKDSVITGTVDEYSGMDYIKDLGEYVFYGEYLLGCTGALYKSKFLSNFDQSKLLSSTKSCYLSDDFYLSNYLKQQNIPIVVCSPIPDTFLYQNAYGFSYDALNAGANIDNGNILNNISNVRLFSNNKNYRDCSKHLKDNNELFMTGSYKID